MKLFHRFLMFLAVLIAEGCALESAEDKFLIFSYSFDFDENTHDWQPGFSEYPAGKSDSSLYQLQYAYTALPSDPAGRKAIMLSGHNRSEELFMYIRKKITDLAPDTDYTVSFEVEMASETFPTNLDSNGPAAPENVFLKVGATSFQPKSVVVDDHYVLNLDKGFQSASGEDMTVIGTAAVTEGAVPYALVSRSNSSYYRPKSVRTNSNGELWLIVGTDSSFEGITAVYYTNIAITFSKVD
ncbi:MAG: hypothetical protein ACOYXT_27745 [Bacteroidota bacterium]